MSADIVGNISRGWGCDPAATAIGSGTRQISCARWQRRSPDVHEVWADPDPLHHAVAVTLRPLDCEMTVDGSVIADRRVGMGNVQIVRALAQPRAVFRGAFDILHIYVPTPLVRQIVDDEGLGARAADVADPCFAPDVHVSRLAHTIMGEMRSALPLSRLRIDAVGLDLVIHILRLYGGTSDRACKESVADRPAMLPPNIRRAIEYLRDNLGSDPGLDDTAREADLSRRQFSRAFKAATGESPHRWLTLRRIEHAQAMLRDSSKDITGIALECGFASSQHFATTFRMIVGETPSRYRQSILS